MTVRAFRRERNQTARVGSSLLVFLESVNGYLITGQPFCLERSRPSGDFHDPPLNYAALFLGEVLPADMAFVHQPTGSAI